MRPLSRFPAVNFLCKRRGALACVALLALFPSQPTGAQVERPARVAVEGAGGEWYVEGAERAGDARVAEHLGRQALWLRNSTHVVRDGVDFTDGTIEFDVAPTGRGNFVGILFRRESFQNQENVYLRIHRSGLYNAVQYAPRVQGSSTWQLYPEFNAAAELPRDRWTRVRVEVRGTRLEVFVGEGARPALSVARLRGPARGSVAFWGRVNERPAEWAAALSNISVRPATAAPPGGDSAARPAPPAGTLASWEVAGPVQAAEGAGGAGGAVTRLPELKGWRAVEAEESGLVNLNRVLRSARGRWTAFARTTVRSRQARTALLELGYSDDVTVFLNGEPVYAGVNGFESRHPEYMGFVKPGHESVWLRLRPGDNELLLAVTDDQRFGWGFVARMKEAVSE
jgi:hypothetical protein